MRGPSSHLTWNDPKADCCYGNDADHDVTGVCHGIVGISCVYTMANIVPAKDIPGYFCSDYIRVASTLHYAMTLRTLAALTRH